MSENDDTLWEASGTSVFRPSYSATWLNCSGALIPSQYAEDSAGEEAAIGTVFHALIAEWQLTGEKPDYLIGQRFFVRSEGGISRTKPDDPETVFFEVEVDEDMFVYGQQCLDYVAQFEGEALVETRVDISSITPIPNQGGTADRAVCSPGILHIIDWKYGRGVQVFAEKNTQLLCYGWGFFQEYDWIYHFDRIFLHIAQPRFQHFEFWEISREELIEWAAWAKERAAKAWTPGADRSPSPKACQWCKVRVDCTALAAAREAIADQTFEVLDEPMTEEMMSETKNQLIVKDRIFPERTLPSPGQLSTADLAGVLKWRKLFENWFSDIQEELTTRALQGEDVLFWKITEGRSRRRWADENTVSERLGVLLGDDLYERKLVSPAQAEKLLRAVGIRGKLNKAYVELFTERPPGRPTLAPDGDSRSEIPNIVDQSFEIEDEEI